VNQFRSASLIPAMLVCASATLVAGISGPVSGYLFDDATGQIRPIVGIPGGAVTGAAVTLPFALKQAVISPAGVGIGVSDSGQVFVISALNANEPKLTQLAGVDDNPNIIVLSQTGTAAALYWKDGAKAQVFAHLPDHPYATSLDLSAIPGEILAIAPDNTGSYLLAAATSSQNSGAVYRATPGDSYTWISALATGIRPSAVQFLPNGLDAAVVDEGADQVFLIANVSTAPEQRVLAISADGVHGPTVVTTGDDYVLAGNADSPALILIGLRNGFTSTIQAVDLPCPPARLSRLAAPHLYLLGGTSSGPIYLLDNTQSPITYFVPGPAQ